MKTYIDVSVLAMAAFVTGIQRVTREIVLRLVADPAMEVILLHYHAAGNCYYRIDSQAFYRNYTGRFIRKEKMVTRQKVPLSEIRQGTVFFDLDAAWMCRARRSYLLPILKKQGAVVVAHIYDIISITHPQYCLQRGVCLFMDYIGAHLQYADALIVNAQATAAELERLAEQAGCALPPCTVVPLGADFQEKKAVSGRRIRKSLRMAVKSCRPYLLMVGTIEPRKNHKLLLQAYEEGLRDMGYSVVFAGYMGWDMQAFEQKMKQHPDYGRRIFYFSGLKDEEISYLYQHARFLVFCSYTEGFGLPVLESLQRGTPVLAADIPVTREAAGDACVYFVQDSAEQLCSRVSYFESHREAYDRLRQRIKAYRPGGWKSCYLKMRQLLRRAGMPSSLRAGEDKKVGIVIPSLNQGKYIEEALQSVIANKKHADIELAVMDGGSQDQTLSVIKKYESEITLWHSGKDNGQAAAVNRGIQELRTCRYLMWLNADDVYEDEYAVKKIVDYAFSSGCEVCYGLSHFIDENGQAAGEYPVEDFDRAALGDRCYLSQPGVLFSRRAYEQTGPLNEKLQMCLDYEYWIRLSEKYDFGFIKEYIGATRMHAQTKTATMQAVHAKEAIRILYRYYGKVPVHWVVTKVLADHPQGLVQAVPKRLLMLVLYPWKGKIIKGILMGNDDD